MIDVILPSISSVVTMISLAAMFGLILSLAILKLRVTKDPRIAHVMDALPGANCGACGMPGCAAYATRIVEEKYGIDLCPVGGEASARAIAGVMGVEFAGGRVAVTARVHCHGGVAETMSRFIYRGPRECAAAQGTMGGPKVCTYGCLGLGDCVSACKFDAMTMSDNGLPVVNYARCTGCGLCVKACPREIISLVPSGNDIQVLCRNEEKAAVMKKGCTVGCIACKLCEKACRTALAEARPGSDPAAIIPAIVVTDNIARIDYGICIQCYRCVEVCPVPVIHPLEKSKKMMKAKSEAGAKTGAKEKGEPDVKAGATEKAEADVKTVAREQAEPEAKDGVKEQAGPEPKPEVKGNAQPAARMEAGESEETKS